MSPNRPIGNRPGTDRERQQVLERVAARKAARAAKKPGRNPPPDKPE